VHEYDIALKHVLQPPGSGVLAELTGAVIERWHNVELPEIANRRADLLGSTASGDLIHLELQSTNDAAMVLRMAEYALAIRRRFDRFPVQIVLYVGKAPLRMVGTIEGPHLKYHCRFADIRELDGETLLGSDRLSDNIIAILARLDDKRSAVRRILERIAAAPEANRAVALKELVILAGLRDLGEYVEGVVEQMPILDDIMDHPVLGRERKRGMAIGRVEGRTEGEREIVAHQLEKRFGTLPDWAIRRLNSAPHDEIQAIALRLLDSPSLEDLLR
jgi:hypothetical protein